MHRTQLIFILITFLATSITAFALNPNDIKVGAIRWDAWSGDIGDWQVGLAVEKSLGPNKYHSRLPFFAKETGSDSVEIREVTQDVMDEDIGYAKEAGLDYWAFVYYPPNSGLETAINLYHSSKVKGSLKYAYIAAGIPDGDYNILIEAFKKNYYQRVLNNRPLFYFFTEGEFTTSAGEISTLRSLSKEAGLGDPYIVVMSLDSRRAGNIADAIGADAISSYVSFLGGGKSYSKMIDADKDNWNKHKKTGKKVIPWVTTGWDPRPRVENPVPWATYGADDWTQQARPDEIAYNLQNALNWVSSNENVAEAATVLMYAWNENDEGGWLAPTLYNSTDRIEAVASVLKHKGDKPKNNNQNLPLGDVHFSSASPQPQIQNINFFNINNPSVNSKPTEPESTAATKNFSKILDVSATQYAPTPQAVTINPQITNSYNAAPATANSSYSDYTTRSHFNGAFEKTISNCDKTIRHEEVPKLTKMLNSKVMMEIRVCSVCTADDIRIFNNQSEKIIENQIASVKVKTDAKNRTIKFIENTSQALLGSCSFNIIISGRSTLKVESPKK